MSDPATSFEEAVHANDAGTVGRLLDAHPLLCATLNEPLPRGAFGATPLLVAVQHKDTAMIDLLLRHGADINARSRWWAGGFGVLDSESGLEPFLIDRGARVDACAASRLGMLDTLAHLVASNPAVVHRGGGDGQTPLHFANSVEIAAFLLAHGAGIDAVDIDHESTPAQYMLRDRQDVARYLVKTGCRTDILMAAALGDLDLTRRQLDADANAIRTTVSDAWFPMRDPRAGGTIYKWVLGRRRTPHQVARTFGHPDVLRLLMDRSPDAVNLAESCLAGDEMTWRTLLRTTPDLARTLSADDTRRLPDAAEENDATAVRLLLAAGWPVDARGDQGATALHWAAWHGNLEMAREILRFNPTVDLKSVQFDSTALQWARHGSDHGWRPGIGDHAAVIELLRSIGATDAAI